eukprot:c24443_g1_i2 orf=91-1749(+)
MPIPTSERRLTRSQLRSGRAGLSSSSPTQDCSPPCKLLASGETAIESKAVTAGGGRRVVLGDLAGNDSPVVGLIPGLHNCAARNPFSVLKSTMGTQSCTKKPLPHTDGSSDTPIGESLLRSQVQLLLERVELDAPAIHKTAPSLRAACHLNNFIDSPALKLLAPTPINTPCNSIAHSASIPPTASTSLTEISASDLSVEQRLVSKPHNSGLNQNEDHNSSAPNLSSVSFQDKLLFPEEQDAMRKVQDSGIKLLVDLNISPEAETGAPAQRLSLVPKSSENIQITITKSVNSGRDHQIMQIIPLISEVSHEAETVDLLTLGKKTTRILKFDSPDKISATEISCSSMASVRERFSSSVREFEEDEASEWSILVNVSSPAGKHDEPDLFGEDLLDSGNSFCEEACDSVHEHLQKNRIGSNKLDLLWSVRRKGTPYRRSTIDDDEEEEDACDAFYSPQKQQGDGTRSGKLEQNPECENLCQQFCDFTFEAEMRETKGLPQAQGKHIKFSYPSDDEDIPEHQETQAKQVFCEIPSGTGVHERFGEEAGEDNQVFRSS